MKKIKEKIIKIKDKGKEKIKENFSGKADLALFILVVVLGLFILHIHYQSFSNSYEYYSYDESNNMSGEDLLERARTNSLNFNYLSKGDVYCLYLDGSELFIKNNVVFLLNDNNAYYAISGKTRFNDFNLTNVLDTNSERFFNDLGEPLNCKINAVMEHDFYRKVFDYINKVL